MNTHPETPGPLVPGGPSCRIHVFGVGGGGGNAVAQMAGETLEGVRFFVLNTDTTLFDRLPPGVDKRPLGPRLTRGYGAGGDPDIGRRAAEESGAEFQALCDGADIVFLLAGLGGGTGTGAMPVLARLARETGALVLAITTQPFACEGGRRQRQAQLGLQHLREEADAVISIPNQSVFKLMDENTPLLEVFQLANGHLIQGVRGIWGLLRRPGLISLNFADLCAVTRGRQSHNALARVMARGEGRAREVVEQLLRHPLLEEGQALNDATTVLVAFAGGPDLALAEIDRVMEQITRHAENAQMVMGASVDPALAGALEVTLVVSCEASKPEAAAPPTHARATAALPAPRESQPSFLDPGETVRPPSRFVAPAPECTPEKTEQVLRNGSGRPRKKTSRPQQGQLKLEIVSKGRFEKSEPTVHGGEDLDVPTYIRRGVALN